MMARFGRGHKRARALRIFFATDVHGSELCFRKFLAAATVYEANVIVMGGDYSGKGLVPVVRRDGWLSAMLRGQEVNVPFEEEQNLNAEINRLGLYPVRMEHHEIVRLREDPQEVQRRVLEEIASQLKRWCDLAAERLPDEVRCVVTPGNDDPVVMDDLIKSSDKVDCPVAALYEMGPVVMASLPFVTPTPWDTERELSEEEFAQEIGSLLNQAPDGQPLVLNFHSGPFGSGLDTAPELDSTLTPVIRGGRPSLVPVGSKAVRDAIMQYRPVLGLHGHVHESRAAQKIGGTLCLNPGSEFTADTLHGVVVDIADDGTVMDFLFTTG
jgi:Icc-related predicted phosphoesterase